MGSKKKICLIAGHRYGSRLATAICADRSQYHFVAAFVLHPRNMARYGGYESPLGVLHKNDIPVYFFDNIAQISPELVKNVLNPDITFVCGLRQLIPHDLIQVFSNSGDKQQEPFSNSGGLVCFHPSKLPAGRGLSPIQWTIFNDESVGAVSAFFVDYADVDSGPIITTKKFNLVHPYDATILDNLIGEKIEEIFYDIIQSVIDSSIYFARQDADENKIATQLNNYDKWIDLDSDSIGDIHRKVMAFSKPYAGVFALIHDFPINIFKAHISCQNINDFQQNKVIINNKNILYRCRDGNLEITEYNFLCDNGLERLYEKCYAHTF